MKTLLLIDGNSLMNRAFYALPFFTNKKGVYTGAVFGFANMLLKAIETIQPDHIAVAFDASRETFRKERYADYKATRKETPKELIGQFDLVKNMLDCMNITRIEKKGIEADDILGTIAKSYDGKTYILSGDRDMLQLVDENITVLFTKKGITKTQEYTNENIVDEYGVTAEQVIDLKALMGDKSDNIPGLAGVGEIKGRILIEEFGSIDNIYLNIDKITGALKKSLIENKDIVYLSKFLVTIKTDCELDYNIENFNFVVPFGQKLKSFFKDMGFESLLKRSNLFENSANSFVKQDKNLETVHDLEVFIQNVQKVKKFAFCLNGEVSFAFDEINYILPMKFDLFSEVLTLENCLKKLKPVFEDDNIEKVTFDLKSQLPYLVKNNIDISKNKLFDYSIMRYLVWAGKDIQEEPISASYLFQNYDEYKQKLQLLQLEQLYYDIELPLIFVLYNMEQTGFKIDVQTLLELKNNLQEKISSLSEQIWTLAGQKFNLNSPKQIGDILYDKLGLVGYLNKKRSTNVDALNELANKHPIVSLIIQYRKFHKLYSSYVIPYTQIVEKQGDIIKTVFSQTTTATGRLSSSEPNLQNIPVRDGEGKALRKIFVSRFDNGVIMSADYNQIELRLLAHVSEDENLLNCFNNNIDVHSKTASEIFGVDINCVNSEMRRTAKTVNFGIIYGISDYGLATSLGMPHHVAKEYKQKYFEAYPKVLDFQGKSVQNALQNGFVKTLYGRIRHIPEIQSTNYMLRQFGERIAINMPLQGTSSDIIKIAMIKVYNRLKQENLKSKLILQIHDELMLDVAQDEIQICQNILLQSMQNVIRLKTELPVSISWAHSWFDC